MNRTMRALLISSALTAGLAGLPGCDMLVSGKCPRMESESTAPEGPVRAIRKRDPLDEAIAAAETAQSSKELDEVQSARDILDAATIPLASVLMDSVVKEAVAGKKLGDV